MPAKGKKPSKKTNGIAHHEPAKLQDEEREHEAERLAKLKQQEQERQRKWIDDWDRKIAEDKRLEDCKACCAPDRFFPKPRTQSNIWIQVNHEKSTQQVQMSFMNVPIPKPRAPPLPRLRVIDDRKTDGAKSDSNPITAEPEAKKPKTTSEKNKKK